MKKTDFSSARNSKGADVSPAQRSSSKQGHSADQEQHSLLTEKHTESAGETAEDYTPFFNLSPFACFVLGAAGTILRINPAACSLLKGPENAFLNRRFGELISSKDEASFNAFFAKLSEVPGTHRTKLALQGALEVTPIRLDGVAGKSGGTVRYYLCLHPERNGKESDTLKELSAQFSMMLEAAPASTWRYQPEHKLFQFGAEIEKIILNCSGPADVRRAERKEKLLQEQIQRLKEYLLDAMQSGSCFSKEFPIFTPFGPARNIKLKGQSVLLQSEREIFTGIVLDNSMEEAYRRKVSELKQSHAQELSRTQHAAREKERCQLSRALHDSVCQLLYGVKLHLLNASEIPKDSREVRRIHQLLDQAIRETRNISYTVFPALLSEFGLKAGIEEMAGRLSTLNFDVQAEVPPQLDNLAVELQLSIFRVVQELLNNCMKHASASRVRIRLQELGNEIHISVADNGVGFKSTFMKGTGLNSIQSHPLLKANSLHFIKDEKMNEVRLIFEKS